MTIKTTRVVKEYTHRVQGLKDRVFALLCPERECEWLDGWSYEMVHSESGVAEMDCVFRTNVPEMGSAIWVISKHDSSAGEIQFVITYPQTHVERLKIQVREIEKAVCELYWRRTYTTISDQGQQLVNHLTGPAFLEKMDWVARSLDHFCRQGTCLSLPKND